MNKILFPLFICLLIGTTLLFAEEGNEHDHAKEHSSQEEGSAKEHDDHEDRGDEDEEGFVEISKEKVASAGIEISKVKRGFLTQELVFPGEVAINGDLLVHVAPRFEGTLKKVAKHIGEEVKKDDLLATVQSNSSLTLYEIKAETDGVVIDKDAAVGEFVTSDKAIFTIANFDTVWINAAINSQDLASVKKGQQVKIVSKATQVTSEGVIEYIRPTLSETTRTALARIVLDNKDGKWLPGMFVNVELNFKSQEQEFLIPIESAVFMNNEYVAFIEGTSPDGEYGFQKKDIEIGISNKEEIHIISGLNENDLVASGETFILKAELGKGSAEHCH